eukprot:SAG11_NODE_2774_length_2985_cov_1.774428_2_plen_273_part_00
MRGETRVERRVSRGCKGESSRTVVEELLPVDEAVLVAVGLVEHVLPRRLELRRDAARRQQVRLPLLPVQLPAPADTAPIPRRCAGCCGAGARPSAGRPETGGGARTRCRQRRRRRRASRTARLTRPSACAGAAAARARRQRPGRTAAFGAGRCKPALGQAQCERCFRRWCGWKHCAERMHLFSEQSTAPRKYAHANSASARARAASFCSRRARAGPKRAVLGPFAGSSSRLGEGHVLAAVCDSSVLCTTAISHCPSTLHGPMRSLAVPAPCR